ncbi:AraC family transcriptional regulator, partial [Mesorhizobium sp. M8A.F.Ca.ET.213.01.1.1]|uniref:DJ-1/PfpI family protein n=1 Tax=Mesorhizobium sp. M8A.F.Ca.ET.213.01.1.1 TaxID=2563970 RepID=UPI00113578C3
ANDFKIQAGEPAAYEVMVVAASPRIRTSAGLVLEATLLPPHGSGIDTLIVPGGWGVNAACEEAELIQWIIGRSRDATRTASVCSGAMLLAEAGLLDGRRAVTHWGRCAEFTRR